MVMVAIVIVLDVGDWRSNVPGIEVVMMRDTFEVRVDGGEDGLQRLTGERVLLVHVDREVVAAYA